MLERITEVFKEGQELRDQIIRDQKLLEDIQRCTLELIRVFKNDGAVFFAGNGGSAADAQHLAAEFVGRFYYDRKPLRAEAISTNTSDLTCIGNDYGYEYVFSRAIQGKGRKGDVLFALTTSGNSPNIILAAKAAREMGMHVIGLTGETGGELSSLSDICLKVPSRDTPRIQECHITIGHIICELVESSLFPKKA